MIIDMWNSFRDSQANNFVGTNSILADYRTTVYGPPTYGSSTLYQIEAEME
jgi:hypothetical protein